MLLVFNSPRRVLKLKGYPMLAKEIVEIVECGELMSYRAIEYVRSIEKYS